MRSKWFVGFASPCGLVAALLVVALPASADVCSGTSNTTSPAYSGYAPADESSYPSNSGESPYEAPQGNTEASSPYSNGQYVQPVGCPAYSYGQWMWDGASWVWCPAAAQAIAPVGEAALVGAYSYGAPAQPVFAAAYWPSNGYSPAMVGYYGTGSPSFDIALGIGNFSLFYGSGPYAYAPFGFASYGYPIAYAPYPIAPYGFISTTNIYRTRVVRVINRDFDRDVAFRHALDFHRDVAFRGNMVMHRTIVHRDLIVHRNVNVHRNVVVHRNVNVHRNVVVHQNVNVHRNVTVNRNVETRRSFATRPAAIGRPAARAPSGRMAAPSGGGGRRGGRPPR